VTAGSRRKSNEIVSKAGDPRTIFTLYTSHDDSPPLFGAFLRVFVAFWVLLGPYSPPPEFFTPLKLHQSRLMRLRTDGRGQLVVATMAVTWSSSPDMRRLKAPHCADASMHQKSGYA
jgi:hypothetical protein